MAKSINYAINFDFEEVNSAAFRNAQLHFRKRHSGKTGKIMVIVPYYFKDMFSNADLLAVISPEVLKRYGLSQYRRISEDIGDWNRRWPERMRNRLLEITLGMIPERLSPLRSALYSSIYYSYRARKYYVNSGLEAYCLNYLKRQQFDFKYLRISDYFDASTFRVGDFKLISQWDRYHLLIDIMIRDANLYYYHSADLLQDLSQCAEINQEQVGRLKEFLDFKGKKVILRTRNFLKKAPVHNSKPEIFYSLAKGLVENGVFVLNLGCPLLKFPIDSPNYFEIDHNMPFGLELALCQNADACLMTAEAGIFHAFAASAITLIQFEEEAPKIVYAKEPVCSWFDSRKKIGLRDIDIRGKIESKEYASAVRLIIGHLGNSTHPEFFKPGFDKPQVIQIK
ncbi:MAG: hypothetical protein PHT31_00775 [Candidatus Omnitrophica bacterium]|nr:hypothetical protein [Candidatus Omnitrophota bacterium]